MAQQKRVFERENQDGTVNTVTMQWDSNDPKATFNLEAEGFKGSACVEELGTIEDIIGTSTIEAKPEMYEGDDAQDVFIVGMN